MNYYSFENAFSDSIVFSIRDIKKQFPEFDNRRLVEWQKKGYLLKIRRGYYCFSRQKIGSFSMYYIANKLYKPSYISLESAMEFYNFIPEGVFTCTSITTRNTSKFDSQIANFSYNHIKKDLFFGYRLVHDIHNERVVFKIAEPEKVILDYFYLKRMNSKADINALRLNGEKIKEEIDFDKLKLYLSVFNSHVLNQRIKKFKEIINA